MENACADLAACHRESVSAGFAIVVAALDQSARNSGLVISSSGKNPVVNVNAGPNITIIVAKLLAVVDDVATKEKLATALLGLDSMSSSLSPTPPKIDAIVQLSLPAIDAGASPALDSVTCDGGEPPAGGDSELDKLMREGAA